jgi:hypothetical protein
VLSTLSRFTTPSTTASQPTATASIIALGSSVLAQEACVTLFEVAAEHSDMLRHGWATVMDAIMRLHKLRLLNSSVFFDDSVRRVVARDSAVKLGSVWCTRAGVENVSNVV